MPLSLVIFDCDGVLLENMDVKAAAFRRIGDNFSREMGDRLAMYHALRGGVSRFEKFDWLYRMTLGRSPTDEEAAALNERFVQYALEAVAVSPLVKGAREALERWKGRKPLYVASGAPQKELEFILEKRGLAHYFDGIYGYPPAKTELLRQILADSGLPARETVMIGDSRYDLQAAEEAGTLFYGRGEFFRDGQYPWHDDLTKLNEYLEGLDSAGS